MTSLTSASQELDVIPEKGRDDSEHKDLATVETTRTNTSTSSNPIPRKSYLKRMAPLSGTYSEESLIKMILRPFTILSNPVVLWVCIMFAFIVVWAVVISFVIAQIFSAPPFLLSTAELGYLSAGPVIGGTIGCLACGFVADPFVKWLTKKNGGIYEPEFRLWLMVGLFVFASLGYFMFGNLIAQGKSPAGIACVWALIIASIQFGTVAVSTYVVDAYRNISIEIFIIAMVFKNFLFFGFTCKSTAVNRSFEFTENLELS